MLHIHNPYESGGGVGPKDPVEITLRRVDSLTVSELDDIWAVTSRYIDTERADLEAQLRARSPRLACGRFVTACATAVNPSCAGSGRCCRLFDTFGYKSYLL